MPAAWIEAQPAPPWTARLYARAPVAPIWMGLLIALLYLLASSVYFLLTGSLLGTEFETRSFWQIPGWWASIVSAILVGLAPTILVSTLRTVERDVRDLAPALGATPAELEAEVREVARLRPGELRAWGVAGAALFGGATYLDPGLWSAREGMSLTNPALLWFTGQQILLGWLWPRAIVADLRTGRAFARLADRLGNVDLLDLRPLAAFGRRGVRSVLYWMVTLALLSLFWLAPYAGWTNIPYFLLLVTVAATNLMVLLRSVHRRIRREKSAQLERVRAAIRADQEALLEPGAGGSAEAAARLPALFAAEARLASVGELPFDTTTVLRFALFLTLGVGSWVGGALVERLLGAALD